MIPGRGADVSLLLFRHPPVRTGFGYDIGCLRWLNCDEGNVIV